MTELRISPAATLFALDLWDDVPTLGDMALPGPGRAATGAMGTVLRVGRRRWWLDGAGGDIAAEIGDRGAMTPIGGGWTRVRLIGDWRDLVMRSGMFDAESPAFGMGQVAVTPLCHAPCVIHVWTDDTAEVLVAASFSRHCLAHWRDLGWSERVSA